MNTKVDLKIEMMIISVVAFLTALIGVSFAWLRSNLASNYSTEILVGSAGLTLSYRGTSSITNLDLAPGEKFEKTFEIENNNTSLVRYNITWKDVTNTLVDKNYFMYTIENVDTEEQLFLPKYLPTNSTHIVYNVPIDAEQTQSYKLTIYYVNDPKYNQLQNANLEFSGDISIDITTGERDKSEILSIFVDGVHSDYLPTLSEYTIDTSRTFCTDGSSIAIVNNDINISNQTNTTTCELYLVSSAASPITHDPYNLLVLDLDGGTTNSVVKNGYRYYGDIIELGIPEKTGYAFLGWEISGTGASITENTKANMGSTYTYVKANWAKGHWNKVVQTCTSASPTSYTRVYKTCEQSIENYTKVEKTCSVSSWNKTTSVCGITEITKKTYTCQNSSNKYSYPSSPTSTSTVTPSNCTVSNPPCNTVTDYNNGNTKVTCTDPKTYGWTSSIVSIADSCTTSGSCTSSTFGNSYVTACSVAAYNFGDSTPPVIVASCTPNDIACTSSTNNQVHRICTPNYSYALSTTETSETAEACAVSEFTCSENTVGDEYTTSCTSSGSGYGYVASKVSSGSCIVDQTHSSCASGTAGQTYISECELIGESMNYVSGTSSPRQVQIGDEEFYVLNDIVDYSTLASTNGDIYDYASTKTILLAKYNLYVGNIYSDQSSTLVKKLSPLDPGYGLQSSSATAYDAGGGATIGSVKFSNTKYWDSYTDAQKKNIYNSAISTSEDWSNSGYSIAYYINEYITTLGISATGRLLTYTEYSALVSSYSSIVNNGTSYWLGSAETGDNVWIVNSDNSTFGDQYDFVDYDGVRPVLIVNTSDIQPAS